MRVLSLNFGDAACASTFYRVLQYVEPLRRHGIQVEPVPAASFQAWDSLTDYDVVLVQKKLFSLRRMRCLRRQARRLIYDTDDAIWEPHDRPHHWLTRWRTNRRLRHLAQAARVCITANQVLAARLRPWNASIEVIPMALDETRWPQRDPETAQDPFVRIGWSGAPVNLVYLESIEPALARLQKQHPEVRIVVYSGRRPNFKGLAFDFVPFEPGNDSATVRRFDIGLLPLPRNGFAEGKSPIKGLQYMASGIATVATPMAATREMFADSGGARFAETDAEWMTALEQLVQDPATRAELGRRSRARFEQVHSLAMTTPRLARLLQAAITSNPGNP
jgi:glycosyltransferase involved in cell wall biosynthesis